MKSHLPINADERVMPQPYSKTGWCSIYLDPSGMKG